MKKCYLIYFWHGRPNPECLFAKKVDKLCRKRPEDGVYFWDGSLEEFATNWGEQFIFLPPREDQREYVDGTIAITPWSNFGQR